MVVKVNTRPPYLMRRRGETIFFGMAGWRAAPGTRALALDRSAD
jgi:hypothetical protein